MRRHAKASTAGSNRRKAAKFALPVSLFAALLALLVVVGSASATKTHLFKEAFGPSAQPTFISPRGMAIDQGTGDVYVIDAGSPPSVKRYNADGTAANFSALSSNVIDGAGGADTTPQGSLAFGAANRVQIAIDESGTATDGDIYVAQQASKLVDVFSSTGEYKGQLTESSEGPLGEVCGVAVDSAGKLYLGDISGKVHVYEPAANPPLNGDSSANFSTVAEPCQIAAGTGPTAGFVFVNRSNGELKKVDSATGEVKYQVGGTEHRTVYVNPGTGHVYAPRTIFGSSEVVEYDASGAASATTVSSFRPGSTIEGVAVRETTGDVYLTRSGQSMVQVYGPTVTQPDVTTTAVSNNTGVHATMNGTVNPDGVELTECKFEWSLNSGSFENTAPCAESNATIGSGTSPVAVHADISGLTPQGTNYKYRLVAKNPETPAVTGAQQNFTTPNTVVTTAASGITLTEATLNGTVNPDGATISECVFEWGTPKESGEALQKYPETAPCVPGPGSITGASPVAVHADISGLHPGTEYVYRLKATYPTGPVLSDQTSLRSAGPAIDAAWAEGVVRSEATLKALINPEGSVTTYHFEYGTSEGYGTETPELPVGSDSSVHQVAQFLTGLAPGTTYHYRVVATSSVGTDDGPDQTFATYAIHTTDTSCANQAYRYGPGANLPDCRGYEMVSPIDKNGADIETLEGFSDGGNFVRSEINQASLNGDKYSFSSYKAFAGAASGMYSNQYLATRGPGGWSTEAISLPFTGGPEIPVVSPVGIETFTRGFSEDLSRTWAIDPSTPKLLSPDAVDGLVNLYERDNATGSVRPLTVGEKLAGYVGNGIEFYGATPDNSMALFSTEAALTPNAALNSNRQVYAYSHGGLALVSVLPGGEADSGNSGIGTGWSAVLRGDFSLQHAISDDGSRIFWSTRNDGEPLLGGKVYVRVDGERTVPVSAGNKAWFWAANPAGSRAIYGEGGYERERKFPTENIYEFDVDSETRTPIAGEAMGVLGASDDLSRIYFVSAEALAPGALARIIHQATASKAAHANRA